MNPDQAKQVSEAKASDDSVRALGLDLFACLLRALGLGLSLFLGLMKLAALPCGFGSGCESVLSSPLGNPFGIPLGFVGALVWLGTLVSRKAFLRRWLHHSLGFGSLVLVALQALVIGHFCPWCLAHAFLSLVAWPLAGRGRGKFWLWVALGMALALTGLALLQRQAARVETRIVKMETDSWRAAALDWLGAGESKAPFLVLSLDCASCWERWLQALAVEDWKPHRAAPLLLWKSEGKTRELHVVFVAAVLSEKDPAPKAFARVLAACADQRDLFLNKPERALLFLKSRFPHAEQKMSEARALVEAQARCLETAGLGITPLWLASEQESPRAKTSFELDWPGL